MYWNTDDDHFRFEVLDISDPASITRLGYLDSIGGHDIHLDRSLAYVSGFYPDFEFAIVSITDSAHPALLGGCAMPGFRQGVWADSARSFALVADNWEGLKVISTSDPSTPTLDTTVLAAGQVEDIAIDGNTACISGDMVGLKVLDVTNPALPVELSCLDTTGQRPLSEAVAVRDSFAFVAWSPFPTLRSVDITDRTRPRFTGGCNAGNPSDIVLRDSFAYVAAIRLFSVINVARPRQPVLVGSCVTGDALSAGLELVDTLAYVANMVSDVVSVADPAHPSVVGSFGRGAWNIRVRDTFAYMTGYSAVRTYSVADPRTPRLLDSVRVGQPVNDIALADSLAYFGCQDGVRLMTLEDPARPAVVGFGATPYLVWRTTYAAPYLYAACSEAGICVYETTQTGVAEGLPTRPRTARLTATPCPTSGLLRLVPSGGIRTPARIAVSDAAGRVVLMKPIVPHSERAFTLDLSQLSAGVYFVELRSAERREATRTVRR
jgi:hypothetical protein